MDCQEAAKVIDDILDGACDEQARALPEEAHEHLKQCAECRHRWDELCRVDDSIRQVVLMKNDAPSRLLRARVIASLREEEFRQSESRRQRRHRLIFAAGLAAAVCVIVAGAILSWDLRNPAPVPLVVVPTQANAVEIPALPSTAAFDIAMLFEKPKQDLAEFAGSILSVTNGYINFAPPSKTASVPNGPNNHQ